jgi:hypothetical protein
MKDGYNTNKTARLQELKALAYFIESKRILDGIGNKNIKPNSRKIFINPGRGHSRNRR